VMRAHRSVAMRAFHKTAKSDVLMRSVSTDA